MKKNKLQTIKKLYLKENITSDKKCLRKVIEIAVKNKYILPDEKCLRKAIEIAVKNKYILPDDWELFIEEYEHPWGWHIADYNGDSTIEINIMENKEKFIFNIIFAKALDYKLKDLGEWCDKGKNPLEFIKKLI